VAAYLRTARTFSPDKSGLLACKNSLLGYLPDDVPEGQGRLKMVSPVVNRRGDSHTGNRCSGVLEPGSKSGVSLDHSSGCSWWGVMGSPPTSYETHGDSGVGLPPNVKIRGNKSSFRRCPTASARVWASEICWIKLRREVKLWKQVVTVVKMRPFGKCRIERFRNFLMETWL
jgi:hypothetical protein